jgi:two-component system OmpR family sensor kinase/two-component system sensor histidine kinase BaeS
MMRRVPFWLKLFGAFLAVVTAAVGGVAIVVNRSASSEFGSYVDRGRIFPAQILAPIFESYYEQAGSWQGAEELAHSLANRLYRTSTRNPRWEWGARTGPPDRPAPAPPGTLERIVVTDADGRILVDSAATLLGKRLSEKDLRHGAPLFVDGEPGGHLLVGQFVDQDDSLEAEFLRSLDQALLLAALLAGGAALVLALLLSRSLSGPLQALAAAAGQLAAGKRGLRVGVGSGREVGLLARSFNAMAESLERQETLRQQMIADIAHELRTPLAVIRGNLEALLDGIYQPNAETILPIHEEALLLTRLVDELRDLALAEAGQLPLHLERVDPVELLRGVMAGFQAQANERSIELPLVLPPARLPAIEVDPGRIRQVLSNLLSNALRHTPQRGRVRVALQQISAHWVQVRVSDNGVGIDPQDLPHLFDRFYRGGRARTRDGSGTGLGLAIARQWVEAHGGSIRAESAPGQGTTFTFTLPISKQPAAAGRRA